MKNNVFDWKLGRSHSRDWLYSHFLYSSYLRLCTVMIIEIGNKVSFIVLNVYQTVTDI